MHYSLARATTWNLAGYIYLIIASLISTPIILHGLGVAQFGLYSLIFATIILVSAIDLGLPQAVVRALSHEHSYTKKRQTIWATSSLLFIVSGVIGGIIAMIVSSNFHVSTQILVLVFALCLMNNLIGHYSTLAQAEGRFGWFNVKTFVVGTGNTFLAAYLAYRGYSIEVILVGQLMTYLVTVLALAYFSLRHFPNPRQGRGSMSVANSLLGFGLRNQAGKLVGQVQGQYGKYLLSGIAPLSLSAYIIGAGLVQKLAGGITQVATALYPATARNSHGEQLSRTYHQLQLGLAGISILGIIAYQFIGLPFLTWWLHSGEIVQLTHSLMKVLVWYLAVLVLTPLCSTILDGKGKPEITSLFAFVTATIEIGLAFILYPRYGVFAPVYSALIAVSLTTPALLYMTEKVIRLK